MAQEGAKQPSLSAQGFGNKGGGFTFKFSTRLTSPHSGAAVGRLDEQQDVVMTNRRKCVEVLVARPIGLGTNYLFNERLPTALEGFSSGWKDGVAPGGKEGCRKRRYVRVFGCSGVTTPYVFPEPSTGQTK
ncbi:hypothetical protein KM043_009642 [Ampulex compressa]|nr:hypothetical protein KM043_009642 [Ampulex compressa]